MNGNISRKPGTKERVFSLTYPHEIARTTSKNSIIVIETKGEYPALRLGFVRSVLPISTFDSRVVFDLVQFIQPSSLEKLLDSSQGTVLRASIEDPSINDPSFVKISPQLGQYLIEKISSIPENIPILRRFLVELSKPKQFEDGRAMQQDATDLALKIFDVHAAVRLHEDAVIEHDARSIPGWNLIHSHITGRSLFKKRGGELLEIVTANKRPLEELLGVDLIYINHTQNASVMLQYKMMEPSGTSPRKTGGEQEWTVRIDKQFRDQLARMEKFNKNHNSNGSYRLNSSPFFIKLIKRYSKINASSIILSLEHLNQLIAKGGATGPRNGLRISYQKLAGHYLRGNSFVELVRSGYIGTHRITTEHFERLIDATLAGDHSFVAAIHSKRIHG